MLRSSPLRIFIQSTVTLSFFPKIHKHHKPVFNEQASEISVSEIRYINTESSSVAFAGAFCVLFSRVIIAAGYPVSRGTRTRLCKLGVY